MYFLGLTLITILFLLIDTKKLEIPRKKWLLWAIFTGPFVLPFYFELKKRNFIEGNSPRKMSYILFGLTVVWTITIITILPNMNSLIIKLFQMEEYKKLVGIDPYMRLELEDVKLVVLSSMGIVWAIITFPMVLVGIVFKFIRR